jgi:hypothetical protein
MKLVSFHLNSDNVARLPLPARHSPEPKPMADGQGTSGQALCKILEKFYPNNYRCFFHQVISPNPDP